MSEFESLRSKSLPGAGDLAALLTFTPRVRSVADDPVIPLATSVPTSGTLDDALAFIARQHDRLASGAGYSFAVVDAALGEPVGQIGLWLRDLESGRASIGYWIGSAYRRRGYAVAALDAISRWGCR
jgi:ribosomal-protein-alanine N-acetyltransferase